MAAVKVGVGALDSNGLAQAQFNVPNVSVAVGLRVHSAFVTLDATAPDGIRSISKSFIMTIS